MRISWDLGPIAHRGLHNEARNIVENSPAAVKAAIDGGYGIEVDLQLSSDNQPIVFHDFTLDRLTGEQGLVRERTATELQQLAYREGSERIITLETLLEIIDGAVPLYVELKSDWSGDLTLATETAGRVTGYRGPLALMSFNPAMMQVCRSLCPGIPIGLVSGAFAGPGWGNVGGHALKRFALRHLLYSTIVRPAFINYNINMLSSPAPRLLRSFGLPLLTWTVRTLQQRQRAERWADAMVFEGFEPDPDPV